MNSDIKLDEIVLVVLEDFMVSARYVLWPLSCDLCTFWQGGELYSAALSDWYMYISHLDISNVIA